MCGIVGYLGKKNASQILISGLKKLEYRGYDSAGIAVLKNSHKASEILCIKSKGKIVDLEKKLLENNLTGSLGIGHTRWATHGAPNEVNAHPHCDCKKDIFVVHNGIIENYHSLKELLIRRGHKFVSETDTEVIAHLIESFYADKKLEEAVAKALKLVEGTFGIAVMSLKERKIIAARRGSPLVIGSRGRERFIASDTLPILPYTKKVVYLNDNELAIVTDDNVIIKNLDGKKIAKQIQHIKWSVGQIEKKGFKHFMLKEIFEQPESISNTLRGRISGTKTKLTIDFDIKKINRVIIVACGTSWHSALIGKFLIEKITGIPVEVDYASEFRYRSPIIKKSDLLVVISQSGETADTLAALHEAKFKKAKTLGIINVVGSTIAREVDSGIYLHAGPEIGVASTKAFTCQITALLLLALDIAQKNGKKIENKLVKELAQLPNIIQELLCGVDKTVNQVKKIAKKYNNASNFLYLGRGMNFPVALEGALKLKEISYIHAEGYPAAEMKHGPIALVDEKMPVVFIATKNSTYSKVLSNMQEIKARGGNIIVVTDSSDPELSKLAKEIIKIPECHEYLSPIISIIPLQLLAYYIADLKGINVDKPRNLAKSVTVE
jgi:glucosamine--fructose-6-phosphate aminotransferase (isomerizing)